MPTQKTYGVERRTFLKYMASLAAVPLLDRQVEGRVTRQPKFTAYPFSLGVASGEPSHDGFVIWTRLAPKPYEGGGMPPEFVEVQWQIAHDEAMTQPVASGAAIATPQLAHAVHVELRGLEPDRWYFYQFKSGNEVSPVGRTRTTPRTDVETERLRFAFASCQHFEYGLFTAYEHMAQEDLDLVVHLGDYIYEYAGNGKRVRMHHGPEIKTLDQYRTRYAQYRLDAHLAETHRRFPWVVTWDDHEFDNNYANLVSEEQGIAPEELLYRRVNAYQAYYEAMPLRKASLPQGPHMQLYRKVRYGDLADFLVLDTRQYRTDQPNNDGNKDLTGDVLSPEATMLGDRQESWLMSHLIRSQATWNVLAQQVMMARVDRGQQEGERAFSMDQWPGYDVSRRRILQFLADRSVPNPVVLTGDIHNNWVNDLLLDFDNPDSRVVGTEFVGTSISSGGNGSATVPYYQKVLPKNPFVKWFNAERGYVTCTLTSDEWRSDYQVVPYIDKPGAPLEMRASFVVEAGRPGAKPA